MHKNKLKGALLYVLFFIYSTHPTPHVTIMHRKNTRDSMRIAFFFDIKPKDCLFKDFLQFSVDHPSITLSHWKSDSEPTIRYEPLFKNNKQLFTKPCTIYITVTQQKPLCPSTHLYCTYYQKSEKKIKQIVVPLVFPQKTIQENTELQKTTNNQHTKPCESSCHSLLHEIHNDYITPFITTVHAYIQKFLKTSHAMQAIFFIMLPILIILVIICFFIYQQYPLLFAEYTYVSATICLCIISGCMLFYTKQLVAPVIYHLICASFFGCIGLYFNHRGLQLHSHTLQKLCSIIGFMAIVIFVFVCFKTYQVIEAYRCFLNAS